MPKFCFRMMHGTSQARSYNKTTILTYKKTSTTCIPVNSCMWFIKGTKLYVRVVHGRLKIVRTLSLQDIHALLKRVYKTFPCKLPKCYFHLLLEPMNTNICLL